MLRLSIGCRDIERVTRFVHMRLLRGNMRRYERAAPMRGHTASH